MAMTTYRFFYDKVPDFYMPPSLLLFDIIPHSGIVTVDDFFHGGHKTTKMYTFDILKEIVAVMHNDSISFAEETLFKDFFNPTYSDPRTRLEAEIVSPVFEGHDEVLTLMGDRDYPLPPWVTTWIDAHKDSIDELDKLLTVEYDDVGAKRLGFVRKGMKDKCRLDPMFGPILLDADIEVGLWKAGFAYLRSDVDTPTGVTMFEKSLILQTYEKIMTKAIGFDFGKMVDDEE